MTILLMHISETQQF